MRKLLQFLLSSVIGITSVVAQTQVEKVNPKDFEVRYCGSSAKYMHGKHLDYNQGKPKFISINMFPPSLIDTCGSFNLYYEDIAIGSGEGFDHPTLGTDRRNTFCAVLNYVESVIEIPAGTTIDIFVDQSLTPGALPAVATDEFLARAGPFYALGGYGVVSGIFGGNMYDHITTGIDPDALNYDCHVQVNFDAIGGTTNINYWNDYTTTTAICRYDLYTVLLHEVTHAMGWLSAVREAPVTLLAQCVNTTNSFTLYDQEFLYFGDITSPLTFPTGKVVLGPPGSPSINPALNLVPTPLRTNEIWLNDQLSPVNHPVFSGTLDPFYMSTVSSGSLLSHLNHAVLSFSGMAQFSPGFQPDYVIGPTIDQEEFKRTWTLGELRALLTLGYALNPTFSASNSLNGVTNNNTLLTANEPAFRSNVATPVTQYFNSNFADQIPADYTITNNNTTLAPPATVLTIDLAADPNLDDNNGDPISIMPGTLFGIRGVSDGLNDHNRLAQVSPTVIEYTPEPGYHGRAQFGFYLWDGHERGGLKVYTIDVDPSGAFVVPLGGELVINGGYEDGTEVRQRIGNTTFPNTAIEAGKTESYGAGKHYSGAHPYVNLSNNWNMGAGTNIMHAWKRCYHTTVPTTLGQFGFGTISSGASPGFTPIPTAAVPNNERMQRFFGGFNFSTLYNPMSTCGYYRFECDLAFPSGTFVVGQNWDMDLEFITDPGPNPTGFAVIETMPVTVTVTAVYTSGLDAWTHVTTDFFYCGATQVEHINLVPGPGTWSPTAYIDNISIVQQPDPAPMTVTITPDVTICLGSSSQLDVLSVTDPRCDLIYTWLPNTGLSDPGIANPIATPTVTTTYTVTVSDIYNCSSAAAQVTVLVAPGPDATIAPAGPFCEFDPALNLTAASTGGTWSGPGITNAATGTFDPAVAGAGTWTVTYTITDLNGCVGTDTEDITVSDQPVITITSTDVTCIGTCDGTATVAVASGTAPLTFSWSNFASTQSISGLCPGTYDVTVTGANGCTATATTTIYDPVPITLTIIPAGPFCENDPAVNLTASPALGTWSGTGITDPLGGTFDPAVAGVGTWTITYSYTDPDGCVWTETEDITVLSSPDATIAPAGPFCDNGSPVTLSAATSGGVWSGPGITNAATGTFDPAVAGVGNWTVTYTITDPNGCVGTDTQTITVMLSADATIAPAGPFCVTDPAVNLSAATAGGTWSGTGITDPVAGTFDPAVAGVGTHTISYSVGNPPCDGKDDIEIIVLPLPYAAIDSAGPFCENDLAVNLTATTAGGTWSGTGITDPIAGTFDPAVAGAGTHTITYVVGTAPCTATATIDIDVLPAPTVGVVGPTVICTGTSGLVTLCVLTSTTSPSISWSNGATTTCIAVPAPTASVSYSVTVTNSYGCSTTAYHTIDIAPLPFVNIVPSSLTFCLNDAPVSILAIPSTGGVWTGNGITNASTGTFDPAVAGVGVHTITYTYTDGNGCVNSDVVTITVNSLPPLAVLFPISDVCVGDPCFNVVGLSFGAGTITANPGPIGTTNNWLVFDWAQFCPAAAGAGPQTVTLTTAPNANGCVNTATQSFNVNEGPIISFPSVTIDLCAYTGPVALSGLTSGGTCTLTGPYITGGLFDAAAAGVGTHTVTWTCVDGNCSSTTTGTVIVVDNAQWHQTTRQTAGNDVNNDVVTDSKGNVYVVGTFTGSTQIGGPPLTISTSSVNSGAYIARYDDCGALLWVANTQLGVAVGNGVAVDEANGVVYIVGTFEEDIVMADAQSPALLCSAGFSQMINAPGGGVSGFVAQFDMATGCLYFIENVLLPPNRYVDLRTVEVNNNNGSIYVGGRFAFSPASSSYRVLARKYSPAIGTGASLGAPVWDILPLGDGPTQVLNDLDYDENWNRLWMTGNYNPKIQFPGLPTLNASNSAPITTPDAFLAVSMDVGFVANTIMARKGNVQMGGSMTGEGIAVDDAIGSPYWTGTYFGSVPSAYQVPGFNLPMSATANAYMMGYNYAGALLWRQIGVGFGNGQVVGKDVDVNNGQVYYTGDFQNGDIALSGVGTYPFIGTLGNGFWHVYAASYTSNGVGLWGNVTKYNVPLKEDHHANGINADNGQHVFIAGKYNQTMDYWLGAPSSGPLVSTTISTYPYATNAYVMRSEKAPAGAFQKTSGPELLQLAETDFLKADEAVIPSESGHGFEVYPSPTAGESTLRIDNFDAMASYELEVSNLLGDMLIKTTIEQSVSNLDLSAYENGVYMVKVSSTGGSTTQVVVKY